MRQLSHSAIWDALDALAQSKGQSPSGLAKAAGLDPTSFNKSKRVTAGGRLRWPSTESLAKVLDATGTELDEFIVLVGGPARAVPHKTIPLIGLAQAGSGGYFDDGGFPVGGSWEEIHFPDVRDENAYALEISGDSMLPLYRDGDIVIVSPNERARKGDRVIVKTQSGEILAKELAQQSAHRVVLKSLNPAYEDRDLPTQDIVWIARIIWASQ